MNITKHAGPAADVTLTNMTSTVFTSGRAQILTDRMTAHLDEVAGKGNWSPMAQGVTESGIHYGNYITPEPLNAEALVEAMGKGDDQPLNHNLDEFVSSGCIFLIAN
mgnify:CR=1 FL=1